jgi:hypothetical protein
MLERVDEVLNRNEAIMDAALDRSETTHELSVTIVLPAFCELPSGPFPQVIELYYDGLSQGHSGAVEGLDFELQHARLIP